MQQAPIYFENGYKKLSVLIEQHSEKKFFFIVDENTHKFCLPLLLAELPEIRDIEIIEVPVGEETKRIDITQHVWTSLSELGADRNCFIINCGGGVVTDFGGFVASTFKRGVKFINIPTSLLAMVDASVGGKTGINLGNLKNQIGTFAQPEMVIIAPEFLTTLPQEHIQSGFAEMLKHGLIRDRRHWDNLRKLEVLSAEKLSPYIAASIDVKKNVVEEDPLEHGLRKILNAGHTLGHAIESFYMNDDNHLLHGQAVALGLWLEGHIAWQRGMLTDKDFDEIRFTLNKFYSPVALPKVEQILPLLKHDKKNVGERVQFILLSEIGKCESTTYEVSEREIALSFAAYNAS